MKGLLSCEGWEGRKHRGLPDSQSTWAPGSTWQSRRVAQELWGARAGFQIGGGQIGLAFQEGLQLRKENRLNGGRD